MHYSSTSRKSHHIKRLNKVFFPLVLGILLLLGKTIVMNAWEERDLGLPNIPVEQAHTAMLAPLDITPSFSGYLIGTDSNATGSMAWGDMDGDGDLDLAVGNGSQANQLYRNDGGNKFTLIPGAFGTDSKSTSSVAWGDADGDGDLDLAVGNYRDVNRVYRNNGQGSFSLSWESTGYYDATNSLIWGDVNGDGYLDLATGNGGTQDSYNKNQVFVNDGEGSFTLVWEELSTSSRPTQSIAFGDMDQDGDLDIVAGNYNDINQIYENDGQGSFLVSQLSSHIRGTFAINFGDIDQDGDLDLVVGNADSDEKNQLFKNDGQGNFSFAGEFGSAKRTYDVAFGDVDSDGDLDLLVGNNDDVNQIYTNNGSGSFALNWESNGDVKPTNSVELGDYDGDGDLDLAFGNYKNVNQVYGNNGPVGFSLLQSLDPSLGTINDVAWGDMDSDGDFDLIAAGVEKRIYKNDGYGQFNDYQIDSNNNYLESVAWGDVNGDNHLDLIFGDYLSANQVYENDGLGNFTLKPNALGTDAKKTQSIAVGDYDGDEDLDLAVGNYDDVNQVYENDGSGQFSLIWESTGDIKDTSTVSWGDMDGDGDLDLVFGNMGDANQVYENKGQGEFSLLWASIENENLTNDIALGDVDGDGDLDLAVGNSNGFHTGQVNQIYENNGGKDFSLLWQSVGDLTTTFDVEWGDYDGDGDLDLAVGNYNNSSNQLYRNDGHGDFRLSWESVDDFPKTNGLAWGDIDNDGDLDLALSANREEMYIYKNHRQGEVLMVNNSPDIYIDTQFTAADFYASSSILDETTISVPFTIFDAESDLVGRIGAEYSTNGGGKWYEAAGTFTDFQKSNHALQFNGVDNNVAIPDSAEINLMTVAQRTILIRFKSVNPDKGGQQPQQVIYEEGGAANGFNLYLHNGRLYGGAWSDAWGEAFANSGKLQPEKWYHAALVLDSSQNELRLYLDGKLVSTKAAQTVPSHGSNIGIGSVRNGSRFAGNIDVVVNGNWFEGQIDDLQIWNQVLTETKINQYMIEPPQGNETNLAAYWPMDDGVGVTVRDLTTSGNDGTLNNNVQWVAAPIEGIFYWNTFDSKFFGQSDNVVLRMVAYPQPTTAAATGTFKYVNSAPFPIQRPYASAATYPFRARGTQVRVFNEVVNEANGVAGAIVYRKFGTNLAQIMTNESGGSPLVTDDSGYLGGRGVLAYNDQLLAALPMTTTYRTPPQLIFNGVDGLVEVNLNTSASSQVTAEFWLLPTASEGTLFTLGGLTLSNPMNLTINGQTTGISVNDGLPHHVALSWQDSNNAWTLVVNGEAVANSTADISLDEYLVFGADYQGSLDEIRLWNTIRTSQQISETMFTPLSGNEAGLIGYWPVEDSDNRSVNDYSGHEQSLFLTGDAAVFSKPLYTVYHTSGAPQPSGVSMKPVTTAGVQQLVVSKENPLMIFDLDVSLEWDASGDPDYLDRLDKDIKIASEILYDLSNGQIAFGKVNVYQNKEQWWGADIQVYANNNQRPNANLGGIVTNYLTDTLKTGEVVGNAFLPGSIRIGATWNRYGNPGGTIGEDWPRVLAHEFGHYGLFLLDNYLGVEEVGGSKIIVEIDCAGSAMTDAYRQDYSEFLDEITNSAGHTWLSDDCQKSLAEDTYGRSDWETIQKFYPFLKENIFFTHVGPNSLPLAVTHVTIHEAHNNDVLLTSSLFYINDTEGNLVPFTRGEGQAYLYRNHATADLEDDEILYLGSPFGSIVNTRGAAVGDRLCVFDNGHDPPRTGCLDNIQNGEATVVLLDVPNWQPKITVRPVNSTTLEVTVIQDGVSNIHVQLFPSYRPTDTVKALTAKLDYQQNGVYTGQFQFPLTVLDGFVRVWEDEVPQHESINRFANAPGWDGNTFVGFGGNTFVGFTGNHFISWGGNTFVGFGGNRFIAWGSNTFVGFGGNTFVGFGGNTFVGFGGNTFVGFNAPLASPDGQVILYNVDNILTGNVEASLQALPSVPQLRSWLTPIGQTYRYITQADERDNLVIQFQYLQRELPVIEENQLRIYYLDESDPNANWQRLEGTTIDTARNLASVKMPGEGLYTLVATIALPKLSPGWNIFAYPSVPSRRVGEALASLDPSLYSCDSYCYTSVYQYQTGTGWLLYDQTVLEPYKTLVNTLPNLQPLNSYWIYATRPMTPFIQPNIAADTVMATELPPATYYGLVTPSTGFDPQVGDTVEARINGVLCGTGKLTSGIPGLVFVLQVRSDNGSGCGVPEREVVFSIDGQTMPHTAVWNNTVACFHPLDFGATAPAVCESPELFTPIYLPILMRP